MQKVEKRKKRLNVMEGTTDHVAPFVLKTYHMVNDPWTDPLITWGKHNNSFIVIDPLHFSEKILPVYFKHNNFHSFVRQLNIYGFRKVDPNKWEFANEWFLRGQVQLLNNLVRRTNNRSHCLSRTKEEVDDEIVLLELGKLKDELKTIEEELEGMNKRLQTTEQRPQQMIDFLFEVAEDPNIIFLQMMDNVKHLEEERRRLLISPSSSSSSSSSIETMRLVKEEEAIPEMDVFIHSTLSDSSPIVAPTSLANSEYDSNQVVHSRHYPFSLLEGGF